MLSVSDRQDAYNTSDTACVARAIKEGDNHKGHTHDEAWPPRKTKVAPWGSGQKLASSAHRISEAPVSSSGMFKGRMGQTEKGSGRSHCLRAHEG